jgi:hypothetical protein
MPVILNPATSKITKDEIKNRALQKLGVIGVGQTPQAQDEARMESAYNEVYEDLKNLDLATWSSTGTIPNDLSPHVIFLVAWNAVDDYGVSPARYQRIQLGQSIAKREIRLLITPPYESLEEPSDF